VELLEKFPSVSDIKTFPNQELSDRQRIIFEFVGDDMELSQLLNQLIQTGIPVLHFGEDTRNLEEVFMQATQGTVS
jgi:hypothetical protein